MADEYPNNDFLNKTWNVVGSVLAILLVSFILILSLPVIIVAAPFGIFVATRNALYRRRLKYGGGDRKQWKRAKKGLGLGVAELARRLNMDERDLYAFEPVYHETFIPKRRGCGARRLLVPDPKIKSLQRRILRKLLARLRTHPAACGFEKGRCIVNNALPHVGRAVVVRMDIEDYFPATSAERIEWYFRRIGWDAEAAALLAWLTTHDGGLPQGAPTSPRLSNLVNFYLDVQLANFAEKRRGAYTRYADDITFSFPKDYPKRVRGVIQKTARLLKAHGYRMHQRRKLHVRRRHQQQRVTGLVVNERAQLPRRTRRWLRSVEHHLATGRRASLSAGQLAGWRALQQMIDGHDDRSGTPS